MDKQTSDEKLLKIIESADESFKSSINAPVAKKHFGKAQAKPLGFNFNLIGLKGVFKNLKLSLAKINITLFGLGVILTAAFIYALLSRPSVSESNTAYFMPADSGKEVKFVSTIATPGLVRKNSETEGLKRNFFLPANFKVSSPEAKEELDNAAELKNFKLVGIIWSATPEVMIENAKDSRTYTLKKGESFNELFKIKEILRNSAILEVNLSSGTQEIELR